jgi:hypothetical protein
VLRQHLAGAVVSALAHLGLDGTEIDDGSVERDRRAAGDVVDLGLLDAGQCSELLLHAQGTQRRKQAGDVYGDGFHLCALLRGVPLLKAQDAIMPF